MKNRKITKLLNRIGMPVMLMVFGTVLVLNPDGASMLITQILGVILLAGGTFLAMTNGLSRKWGFSDWIWPAVCLVLGLILLIRPLLMARNLGRFLGVLLAMEGGDCRRKGNTVLGNILVAVALALVFVPLTASRLVFSLCGLAVLAVGALVFFLRLKNRPALTDGNDPNIIDAL